jgi:hypothetical protein
MAADEIDLIDLYNAFKKTKLYEVLKNSFNFILKNKVLLLLFLVAGGVGGYFYERNIPPVYRSEMVVYSKGMDNFSCAEIVASLNTLINNQNLEEGKNLSFTKDLHTEIDKIEFIYPQYGDEDRIRTEPFRIAVYSSNNQSFELIEASILNHLLNNPYSNKDQNRKLSILKSEKTELNNEIILIDSTLQILKNQLNLKQDNPEPELAALIKERKNAKQRVEEIKIEIQNNDNFVVLNSFTPSDSPVINKRYFSLKFSILAFFIGFILLRLFKK